MYFCYNRERRVFSCLLHFLVHMGYFTSWNQFQDIFIWDFSFKRIQDEEWNNGLQGQNNDVSKIVCHKMPEHRPLQLLLPFVLPLTRTRLLALSAPLLLNLFYNCHRTAVPFSLSYSSHTTLWLILPVKLHSCTSLCTHIHPSAL